MFPVRGGLRRLGWGLPGLRNSLRNSLRRGGIFRSVGLRRDRLRSRRLGSQGRLTGDEEGLLPVGVAALADDQHHEGDDHQHHAEGLGHPDGLTKQGPVKQVQAVGAHPLDPGPADAVPDEVEAGVLPVEGPGLGDDEDDEEQTDEIPQALVEEGGMDLDVLRGGGPQPHPPGQVGLPAEGLAVDEIPPTPYSLSDEQAHASQVREGAEG